MNNGCKGGQGRTDTDIVEIANGLFIGAAMGAVAGFLCVFFGGY